MCCEKHKNGDKLATASRSKSTNSQTWSVQMIQMIQVPHVPRKHLCEPDLAQLTPDLIVS